MIEKNRAKETERERERERGVKEWRMGRWERDRSSCRGRHVYSCERGRKTGKKVRIVSTWIQMCVTRVYIYKYIYIDITRDSLNRNAMELLGIDKNSLS